MAVFSFSEAEFDPVVAHSGTGHILFTRALSRSPQTGCNFIDLSIIPKGASIGVHTHGPGDEEIYVVIEGEGRMMLDGRTVLVGPGSVIVNRPGGTHGLENIGDRDLKLVVIDVPFPRAETVGDEPG